MRKHHNLVAVVPLEGGPGNKVGIVGIGGLSHMGVKLAHALGAHVVAFAISGGKRSAAPALGADELVVSENPQEMDEHANRFDFIVNTAAASHDLDAYTALLKLDDTMTLVGVPEWRHPSPSIGTLIGKRRSIVGSKIGGNAEAQEMHDFCAANDVVADIELVAIQVIETAFDRMQRSDVKYRLVIDSATLTA